MCVENWSQMIDTLGHLEFRISGLGPVPGGGTALECGAGQDRR